MLARACLLFCIFAVVNLQRIALPKTENNFNSNCLNSREDLIREYFSATTVVRGTSVNQPCNPHTPRQIDLAQLVDFYRTYELVNSYKHITLNNPVQQSGVLSINEYQELPLFLIADIRHSHVVVDADPGFGRDVDEQMELMSELNTDDRGRLLARSLSGRSRASNVVPMARNVHRRLALDDSENDQAALKLPKSFWRSNEDWIVRFLLSYPEGRVSWRLAVQYADGVVSDPARHHNYRPVAFALQYSAFTDHGDTNSLFYTSPETTFLNDNNYTCPHPAEQLPLGRSSCNLPRIERIGTPLQGEWQTRHLGSFAYIIDGRTFIFGQSIDGRFWFIMEMLPDGRMSDETCKVTEQNNYEIVFPFSIDGRQFFYAFSSSERYWFVRELLPGGKMGKKICNGYRELNQLSIPFSIGGKQYFYSQIEKGGHWYINELLSGGEIGNLRDSGRKEKCSSVVFLYKVNDKQFIYSHNTEDRTWCVQEILAGGTMGEEQSHGEWISAHHTSVPYSITGKHYFFGQNLENGYWFVQELLPNGQMGERVSQGTWDDQYPVVVTYVVNREHYLYTHSTNTKKWTVRRLY